MSTNPQHKVRFNRVVKRVTTESFWIHTEDAVFRVLVSILEDRPGLDFFRVSFVALQGDRLIRLVRLLDLGVDVGSFWYLYRCEPKTVEHAAGLANLDLSWLLDVSKRLKKIRDKVFVHIDKAGLFNPEVSYKAAKITEGDVHKIAGSLWQTMLRLYFDTFAEPFPHAKYSGEDIAAVVETLQKR
jgi:hypothetical protein